MKAIKSLLELSKEFMNSKKKRKAVIVFTKDSFSKEFSEKERSYEVSSNNNYFDSEKISNALIGNCLDGKDLGVRLDWYIDKWKIEKIYLNK